MTKVLSAKTRYLEQKIREEYTSADVALWQGLCRQCETEVGDSIEHMYVILDMAKHNEVNVLDVIKCGRVASGQKAVNGRFIECLIKEMYGDEVDNDAKGVLDLTAEEEDLSGSYEETDEKYIDDPNSKEAYEIDGFVVEDAIERVWAPSVKRWLYETNGQLHEDECIHGLAVDEACSECRILGAAKKEGPAKRKHPTIEE